MKTIMKIIFDIGGKGYRIAGFEGLSIAIKIQAGN
jgi:hypothetical protein